MPGASEPTSPNRAKGEGKGVESKRERTPSPREVERGGRRTSVRRRSSKCRRNGASLCIWSMRKTRRKCRVMRHEIIHEWTEQIGHSTRRRRNRSGLHARTRETHPVPSRCATRAIPVGVEPGHAPGNATRTIPDRAESGHALRSATRAIPCGVEPGHARNWPRNRNRGVGFTISWLKLKEAEDEVTNLGTAAGEAAESFFFWCFTRFSHDESLNKMAERTRHKTQSRWEQYQNSDNTTGRTRGYEREEP